MTNYKEKQVTLLAEQCEYYRLLGMEIVDIEPGQVRLRMVDQPKLRNLSGTAVHGGAICSILDAAIAIAVDTLLPQDCLASTVNIQVDFVEPFNKEKEAFAEGWVIKEGNKIYVGEGRLVYSDGTLIAKGLATLIKNS